MAEPVVANRMVTRLRKAATVGVVARSQEPVTFPPFYYDHDDVDVHGGAVSSATSSCSHGITPSSSRLDSSLPQHHKAHPARKLA
ncbi:hypothetical protein FQN49_008880, partial [Arthroderma sp. PD_2]